MFRIAIVAALVSSCGMLLVPPQTALAVSFPSVDLDLVEPNTPSRINVFETEVTVSAFGQTVATDPFLVDYVDPNMRGMQVDLEVDFSDPNNPFVTSIEFVGQPGDLSHEVQGGSIPVDDGIVDVIVTPSGIRGFITSPGGPSEVDPNDGSFNGENNVLVARQGEIAVVGTALGGLIDIDITVPLSDTPEVNFTEPISENEMNFVTLTKTGASGNTFFYDVEVSADLDQTSIDLVLDVGTANLKIDGTLLGIGQITFSIPEPGTIALGAIALLACFARRGKKRGET